MSEALSKKKILLAANCNVEAVVIDAISRIRKRPVELDFIDSISIKGINVLHRHKTYIKLAWRVLRKRKQYESIIFWQQFIALYYILFAKILFVRKCPPSVILTFIFIRRNSFKGWLHKRLYSLAVNSKSVKKLVCHSSSEKKIYSDEFGEKASSKFEFIPIGEGTYVFDAIDEAPVPFYISGGASNRDYATLIEAFRRLDDKLIIACRPKDVEGIDIPDNVELHFKTYGNDFLKLIRQSKALILTINDPNISAGQLVMINAMRARKLSIVTAGSCLDDYAEDDFSIRIKAHLPEEIIKAVQFVNQNKNKISKMEEAALAKYKESYSIKKYGEKIADLGLGAKS